MESVSVLHCADLHLGAPFSGLPPGIAAERSGDLRRAFLKIIELCKTEKIRLLLIAGDLFDSAHVPEALTDMVRGAFNSIPDTFVAIAPGNHDPAVYDSIYNIRDYWPGNVCVFSGGLSYLDLPGINVRLWGAAFTNVYQDKALFVNSVRADPGLLNICAMHADLIQPGGTSRYNPVAVEMFSKSHMDYLALGHVHKRLEISRAGGVYYAYPGSPEGLGFDEKGERGVYIGELSRGVCNMGFRAINRRTYADIRVDVTGLSRLEAIRQILGQIRMDRLNPAESLIRLTLTGSVAEEGIISPEYAGSALSEVFYLTLSDRTVLDVQTDDSGRDFTLRNIFVRRMRALIDENPGDESLKLAMKLGLRAFSEKVPYYT